MQSRRPSRERPRASLVACACALLAACSGNIAGDHEPPAGGTNPSGGSRGGAAGGGRSGAGAAGNAAGADGAGGVTTPSFACDDHAVPPAERLRRLTTVQYRNTVRDLVRFAMTDAATAAAVLSEIAPALARMPDDARAAGPGEIHGTLRRLSQDVQQAHVEAAYDVGAAVGRALTDASRLGRLLGACASDADASNDRACVDGFVSRFAERALRRPIDATDLAMLRAVYGTGASIDAAALADVITVVLSLPGFVFQVEHGTDEVAGKKGVYQLSPFELASRLSYQYVQTSPDDPLLAAARSGALLDPKEYERQVDRLLADARTTAAFDEFYADWLKLDELAPLDGQNGDARFKAFAAANLPSKNLRADMIQEVVDLTRWYTTTGGRLDDLLTTERSVTQSDELAKLYGVARWDGAGEPPTFTPAGSRPGLLTRAALLASGRLDTRPIMKGVFVRETILCETLPPPPEGASNESVTVPPTATTRQFVEALTEQKGTKCVACHAPLINPLGFATEGFDSLGRLRSTQKFFSSTGVQTGETPVETRSVPQVVAGDKSESTGPGDLAKLIVGSGKAHACVATQFFRFSYGRREEAERDGCALEPLRRALTGDGTLKSMWKAVALEPEFRRRSFE